MRISIAILIVSLLTIVHVEAQPAADSAAIHETVLDYVDGWWTGDVSRMERCLHPDLVKRQVVDHRETGRSLMRSDSKTDLVEYTRAGGGSAMMEARGEVEVSILALQNGVASVVAASSRYVDYVHLARWNGRWLIVNVLWAFRDRDRRN